MKGNRSPKDRAIRLRLCKFTALERDGTAIRMAGETVAGTG